MIHIARVDTHDVFVFTRRLECDPHCVVALRAHFGDEGNGIGVAISWCVTRIRPSARHIGSIDRGSLVLIPRVPFADARPRLSRVSRRTLPTCTRRRHADAPAVKPTSFKTMDGSLFGTVHRLPLRASLEWSSVRRRTPASRNERAQEMSSRAGHIF